MIVDFTQAASIRAWIARAPERNLATLRGLWRIWPQWREVIEEATRTP